MIAASLLYEYIKPIVNTLRRCRNDSVIKSRGLPENVWVLPRKSNRGWARIMGILMQNKYLNAVRYLDTRMADLI